MALLNGSSFTLFLPASTSLGQPCFSEPLPFITEVRFDPRRVLESAGFGSSQVEQVLNWSSVPHEGLERTSDVLRLALAASHSLAYQDLDIFDLGRPMPSGPWATAWTGPTTIPNSNTTNASRDVARKAQTYHWSNAAFCLTRPQAVALMGAARVLLRKGETGTTGYRYMEFGPELFQTALQPNTLVPFPGPPVRPRLMLRGQLPPCVQPRITCENEWAQLAQADQRQSCRAELLHLTCKSSHRLLACHSDGQRLISRFVAPAASRTPPRMAPVGSWGACLVGVVRRKTLPPFRSLWRSSRRSSGVHHGAAPQPTVMSTASPARPHGIDLCAHSQECGHLGGKRSSRAAIMHRITSVQGPHLGQEPTFAARDQR